MGRYRITVVSDLHLEFLDLLQASEIVKDIARNAVKKKSRYLVIAGDFDYLSSLMRYRFLVEEMEEELGDTRLFIVPGNHEFYIPERKYPSDPYLEKFSIMLHMADINELAGRDVLNNRDVHGHENIVFATLWFPDPKDAYLKGQLADYKYIKGFEPRVYEENEKAVRFLSSNITEGSVVVTHHAPTFRSVPMEYAGDPLNKLFCNNLDELILEKKPLMWIHGHTHTSFDYILGETRVVCNPMGYMSQEIEGRPENPKFDPALTFEIDTKTREITKIGDSNDERGA